MEPVVFAAVLGASACHAIWNALVKAGGDPLARMILVNLVSALLALALVPFVAVPAAPSWPFLAGSIAIHQAYFAFLTLGYRSGDLSQVYPISRGSAPLLVALGGFLFAGETLGVQQLAAVVLVSAGITSLALERAVPGRDPRAVVFALLTALTIAAYTVVDGMGGRRSADVVGYIVWLFALEGIVFCAWAPWLARGGVIASLVPALRNGAVGGVLAFVAYGLVIWAMSRANMTLVSALRETSVILAALIGAGVLRESLGIRRVVAASVVALGVAWLQIARGG